MDNGECLVFIRDERPVRDKKYDVRRHPNYRYTAEGGGGEYEHRKETRQKRGSVVIGKERIQAMPLREEDLAALSGEWREAI